MTNIINAIINIVKTPITKIHEYTKLNNRVNSLGYGLEEYIKDIFADTLGEVDDGIRNEKINQTFSYLGNTNNPPDAILRDGDAIEVKKIENYNSGLALNSSYPKSKLFSDSYMITDACKNCEIWKEKDIIYIVGSVNNNKLYNLFFVYGIDFAADYKIYENIKNKIKEGILNISDIEFKETKELGRVNKIDPLGITYLRIRGMWHILNPINLFNYVYKIDKNKIFELVVIINTEKYINFENSCKLEELLKVNKNLNIKDIKIKDPNNPANLKEAKIITFYI